MTLKKSLEFCRDFKYNGGLENHHFLLMFPAAGDDPEIITDKIDLKSRIRFKEGL